MTEIRRGRPPYDDVLTPAEWRIAHAVKHGMTNREIARRRGISSDELGLRNRAALRRWSRPPKGSALDRKEKHVVVPSKLGPVGQIARSVRSLEESERWYGKVLGLQHLYTFGKLAFFDCGGTRLLLTQEVASATAESILYFRVENIQATHDHLKAQGIEFINAPHMIHKHADGTEEWMAFFKDLEGRPLAIMSQVKP